jgi:hypothetical protein
VSLDRLRTSCLNEGTVSNLVEIPLQKFRPSCLACDVVGIEELLSHHKFMGLPKSWNVCRNRIIAVVLVSTLFLCRV